MLRVVAIAAVCAACSRFEYAASPQKARVNTADSVVRASSLEAQPAVRHRMILVGSGGGGAPTPIPPVPSAEPLASPEQPEKIVLEAWVDIDVPDVAVFVRTVRTKVEAGGGRVVSENVSGSGEGASSAAMELRVLPDREPGLVQWLSEQGTVESRRVLATDVSRQLFDQELELANLQITMTRLQQLVSTDVPIKELLEIETEMTRVRGEIERLKGEQRFLGDRVAYATVTLTIDRQGGPLETATDVQLHPGPRLSTLVLLDPEDRPRTRFGGGIAVRVQRWLTFDLDVFPDRGDDGRAVIATIGAAIYSELLGGGRRRFLNPYVGTRLGYGYLSGTRVVALGGEVGVELYKQRHVIVDASARALALVHPEDHTDVALHAALAVEVPF